MNLVSPEASAPDVPAEPDELEIQDKILHILSVYPQISPSMLQISLNLPASSWKPALEHLIKDEKVVRMVVVMNTPTGRLQSHTILHLTSTELRLNQDAVV